MNLKKTIVSLFAVGTLLVTSATAVMGQAVSDTGQTTGTVTISDEGQFDAYFCNAVNFDTLVINSTTPGGTTVGTMQICYVDTYASRSTFRTYFSAGHFVGPTDYIGHENLSPSYMYNVGQAQWGSGIGNIGAMKGNANYSGGPGGYVNSVSTEGPWVGSNMSQPQYVNYGNAGIGTTASISKITLKLTVPAGVDGGTYVSEFTLNVTPQTP